MKKKGTRSKKSTKKRLLIILGIIIAVPVLLLIVAHFKFVRNWVKNDIIEGTLREKYNISLKAESLDYNLLKPRVTLKNITLSHLGDKTGDKWKERPPIFSARSITVEAPYSILWKDKKEITLIDIEEPRIHILVDKNGQSNIPVFKKHPHKKDQSPSLSMKPEPHDKPGGKSPHAWFHMPDIILRQLKVPGCRILYENKATGEKIDVPNINLEVVYGENNGQNNGQNNGYSIRLDAGKKGILQKGDRVLPLDGLTLRALLNAKTIDIETLETNIHGMRLSLNGKCVGIDSKPGFDDLRLDVTAPLEKLDTLVPGTMKLAEKLHKTPTGTINIKAALNGAAENPELTAALGTDGPISLSGGLTWKNHTLDIRAIDFQWPGFGQIKADGRLHPMDWKKGNRLDVTFNDINLETLNAFLHGKNPAAFSTASGSVDIQWADNIRLTESMLKTLKGTVKLNVRPMAGQGEPLEIELTARTARGKSFLEIESFVFRDIRARGRFNWNPGSASPLDGNFHVTSSSLASHIPFPPVKNPLKVNGTLSGTFRKPIVTLKPLNAPLAPFSLKAQIDDASKPRIVRAVLSINNLEPQKILGPAGIDHMGLSGDVSGQVNAVLDLKKPMDSLRLNAAFDRVALKNDKIGIKNDGPLVITYNPASNTPAPNTPRLLTVKQMKFIGSGFSLGVSGSLPLSPPQNPGPDNNQTGINLHARANLNLVQAFLPRAAADGQLTVNSRVTGSLGKPGIAADIRLNNAAFSSPSLPGAFEKGIFHIEIKNNRLAFKSGAFDFMGTPFTLSPATVQWDDQRVRIRDFLLKGPGSHLGINGTINRTASNRKNARGLDITVNGSVGFSLIDRFLGQPSLDGKNQFRVHLTGTAKAPVLKGTLDLTDISFEMRDPDIYISRFNGRLVLDNQRIRVENMSGQINGGTLNISGSYPLTALTGKHRQPATGTNRNPDSITLEIDRAKFDYPRGLDTRLSGRLEFKAGTGGKRFHLGGQLNMLYGVFRDADAARSKEEMNLRPRMPGNTVSTGGGLMDDIHLDVYLSTVTPLWIDKRISHSEINAGLTVTGTAAKPGITGRVKVMKGGEIYFNDRTFIVDKGIVDFNDPGGIVPDLDVVAKTRISSYDITLQLTGTPDDMAPMLSSMPDLPQPDIMSLLITGRVREDIADSKFNYQEVGLSILKSAVLDFAEKEIEKYSGLDIIHIDTGDQEKDATITFGKYLGSNLELLFSQDLSDTGRDAYTARYTPVRNILLETLKTMENQYGVSFKHHFFFDLHKRQETDIFEHAPPGASAKPVKPPVISSIQIKPAHPGASLAFPLERLRELIKQKAGKRFDYHLFSRDTQRLTRFYQKRGNLGAEIRPERFDEGGKVRLVLSVAPGPMVSVEYRGAEIPRKIRREIHTFLVKGRLARHAREDAKLRLRYFLCRKGYYKGSVQVRIVNSSPNSRFYIFDIDKGPRFTAPRVHFIGRRTVSYPELSAVFKNKIHLYSIFTDPKYVSAALKHVYFTRGYLHTEVSNPRIQFDESTRGVRVEFDITEGPRFIIGDLKFSGARFFNTRDLTAVTGLKIGNVFSPRHYSEAAAKTIARYRRQGFLNTTVKPRVTALKKDGVINLEFEIKENHRAIIGNIRIMGNTLTKTNIIRRELAFKKGDDITVAAINKTRNNLYDLGIFDQVEIARVPMSPATGQTTVNYRVEVRVRERKQFGFKYGLSFKSTFEKNASLDYGATARLTNYNMFGRGQYFDLAVGWGSREKFVTSHIGLPFFLGKKIDTRVFVQYRDKKDPFPLQTAKLGIWQHLNMGKYSLLSYGYQLSWNREDKPLEDSIYRYRVAGPGIVFRRDSRDNMMDATRGTYQNYSLDAAVQAVGSEVDYIRFSSHFSYYKKIGPFVYAGAVRVGLLKDFGIEAPHGEKFFTGGGTTIRGFGQDKVGPLFDGTPVGGNAQLIVNQELRWRFSRLLGAVVFFDAGNVYPRIPDFSLRHLRESAGVGLRVYTPFVLVRLDLGFKLDRRPGESLYTVFLSFGQAF